VILLLIDITALLSIK